MVAAAATPASIPASMCPPLPMCETNRDSGGDFLWEGIVDTCADEVFDDSSSTVLICTGGLVVPTTCAFWRKLLLVMGEGGGGVGGDGTACFPLVVRFDVGLSGAQCFALSVAFVCVFLGFGASAEARFDVGFDQSRSVVGILSVFVFRVFFAFGACEDLPRGFVFDVRVIPGAR